MKGRLTDLSVGMDGKQRLTLTLSGDARTYFNELKDCDVNVEIRKWRRKRTKDANAYAWALIDKLAEKMQLSKAEVYRELIRNVPGVTQTVCVTNAALDRFCRGWEAHGTGWQTERTASRVEGCTNVVLYFGSSTYDTKQMSSLIDIAIHECKLLGIETITPAQAALLKEEWGRRS